MQNKELKPRILVLSGYLHLSVGLYKGLRKQLPSHEILHYFPKDIIGSDINHCSDIYRFCKENKSEFLELNYSPKWFRSEISTWHKRTILEKIIMLFNTFSDFGQYSELVVADVRRLSPDLIISLSDIFYTSRLLSSRLKNIPIIILQPSLLDLSVRNVRFRKIKRLINALFPDYFNTQPYFGLELIDNQLLLWDDAAISFYSSKRGKIQKVINPITTLLRYDMRSYNTSLACQALSRDLGLLKAKKTIIVFTGQYETLHGERFQFLLEEFYKKLIGELSAQYNIVIKIHPNSSEQYWKERFSIYECAGICIISKYIDPEILYGLSEISIGTNSYASVESVIAGQVAINYSPLQIAASPSFDSIKQSYTLDTTSSDEVISFLYNLLDESAYNSHREKSRALMRKQFLETNDSSDISAIIHDLLASTNGRISPSLRKTG